MVFVAYAIKSFKTTPYNFHHVCTPFLPRLIFREALTGCANIFLTLYNPVFLPTAYSPALICFGRGRGWWITCNYPTVLKEKNTEKQKEYNLRYVG